MQEERRIISTEALGLIGSVKADVLEMERWRTILAQPV